MYRDRQLLKLNWKGLLAGCLLIATIIPIGAAVALAQSRRYSPPRGGSPPQAGSIGGSRSGSCAGETNTTFTALAPYSHIGQTATAHPTFAWYVPDSQPLTIVFRLYGYGADGNLQLQPIYETELNSTPGMMAFTLPETEPGLAVGQRYYWRAALICDPNHGSEDLIVNAELQRVEPTVPESQLWYDLLKQTLNSTAQSQSTFDLLLELAAEEQSASEALLQSAKAATEDEQSPLLVRSQDILQHSQQLRQLVEAER